MAQTYTPMHCVVVRRSTNWVTENNNSVIPFDLVDRDTTGGLLFNPAFPTRVGPVLPEWDGQAVCLFAEGIWLGGTDGEYRELKVFKNGNINEPVSVIQVPPANLNTGLPLFSVPLEVHTGDYFELCGKTFAPKTLLAAQKYSPRFGFMLMASVQGVFDAPPPPPPPPPGNPLHTGLVEWWELGESPTAGSHGGIVLTGAHVSPPVDGVGTSLATRFDGTLNHHLSSGDVRLNPGNSDFTVCAWVRTANVASWPYILGVWGAGIGITSDKSYLIQTGTSTYFYYAQGGGISWVENTADINSNEWAFICAWHDSVNDVWGLRVNGTFETKAMSGGPNQPASIPFTIGRAGSVSDPSTKDIQRVAVWSRVLSVAEQDIIFNAGNGIAYPLQYQ